MTDTVFVHDLEVECLIGTDADERLGPQTLLIDIEVECDCHAAGRSDRLADTVDYRRLVDIVRERGAASRFHLLEALAEDTAAAILAAFPEVGAVRLRVVKPEALPGIPTVGVGIVRNRGESA